MKTSQPYLPLWRAQAGAIQREGSGLLARDLSPLKDSLDEIRVFCASAQLSVKPKSGEIYANSTLVAKLPTPCSLLWFRRMKVELGTHDPNTSAAQCEWYGLGLEANNQRFGWRIDGNGTASLGSLH